MSPSFAAAGAIASVDLSQSSTTSACLVACISHHVGTGSLWRRLPSQPRVWVVAKTKKALLISNIYPDRLDSEIENLVTAFAMI